MPHLPFPLEWAIALAVTAAILLRLAFGLRAFPYFRLGSLMSPAEQVLFRSMRAALQGRYEVFPKIRIADLLGVDKDGTRKSQVIALNRIAAKHVDFVVADRRSLRVLCAVELDDRSHAQRDRRRRDRFVDQAFSKAGLPLVRVRAQARYDLQALREAIEQHADAAGGAPGSRAA